MFVLGGVELAVALLLVFVVVVIGALFAPHFMRGYREARDRRGVDLNMEHRVEQELAEERAAEDEWRQRIDDDLEDQLDKWRQEEP